MSAHRPRPSARRRARAALTAVAGCCALLAWVAPAAAQSCVTPETCAQGGACLSVRALSNALGARYADQDYAVQRVRLRPRGDAKGCVWYEVVLTGRGGDRLVAYADPRSGAVLAERRR